MPAESRQRVVQVAQEEDVTLIDDRTHSDLDHGAVTAPPLGWFDDQSRVITVGGMSKLYWGGLRIGWIRARASLINRLIEQKAVNDLGSSAPMQIIAAELLHHHHDTTRGWRNDQLRGSLDALESALRTSMPAAEWGALRVVRISGFGSRAPMRSSSATEPSRKALRSSRGRCSQRVRDERTTGFAFRSTRIRQR